MEPVEGDAVVGNTYLSRIVGIDPGQKGAIAFLDLEGDLIEVEDMPVIEKSVNPTMVSRLILGLGPVKVAVIERAQTMPEQGIVGAFNYGTGYGMLLGVLAAHEIPVAFVTPSEWKRHFRLTRDKNLSRKLATERWPRQAEMFKLVKHDGRAEAALLAAAWMENNPERVRLARRRIVRGRP